MKIALALDDTLDKPDGVQQYIITLGEWLSTRGHTVHYLVASTKRRDISNVHSLARIVSTNFNGNTVRTTLPVLSSNIRSFLKTENFDVLHVQMPFSPLFTGRLVKLAPKNTAVVGTFHILPFSTTSRLGSRLLGLLTRPTAKRFKEVLAVSQPASKLAQKMYGHPVSVVPNAINLDHFKENTNSKSGFVRIAYLGRLVKRKGCQHLLEAVKELVDKDKINLHVEIGGDGPLRTQLERFVAKNNLSKVVHFKGFVSEADKPSFLGRADIAVFPSTGGESFGIVLLEAMAAGKPVVLAGDNPGYRSVLSRSQQLFNPMNVRQLARLLQHFATSAAARQQARLWQNAHIKQFDIEVVGKQVERVYTKALQSGVRVQ